MPSVSLALATIIFVSGAAAGSLGALLGIGGGVFFVPLLHLALGFPLRTAAAVSLSGRPLRTGHPSVYLEP